MARKSVAACTVLLFGLADPTVAIQLQGSALQPPLDYGNGLEGKLNPLVALIQLVENADPETGTAVVNLQNQNDQGSTSSSSTSSGSTSSGGTSSGSTSSGGTSSGSTSSGGTDGSAGTKNSDGTITNPNGDIVGEDGLKTGSKMVDTGSGTPKKWDNMYDKNGNQVNSIPADPEKVALEKALADINEEISAQVGLLRSDQQWVSKVKEILREYMIKLQRVMKNTEEIKTKIKALFKRRREIQNLMLQMALKKREAAAQEDLAQLNVRLNNVKTNEATFRENKLNVMQTIAEIKSTLNKLQTPTTDRATKTADKLKSSEGVYDGSGGPGGEAVSRTAGGDSFLEVGENAAADRYLIAVMDHVFNSLPDSHNQKFSDKELQLLLDKKVRALGRQDWQSMIKKLV